MGSVRMLHRGPQLGSPRRSASFLAAIAFGALVLVGCGGDEEDADDSPTATVAATRATSGGQAASPAAGGASPAAVASPASGATPVVSPVEATPVASPVGATPIGAASPVASPSS
jgi:hypothetical protein